MKINKNKNKLNGGDINSYLIRFLTFCVVIIFGTIFYNMLSTTTYSKKDCNIDNILKPLSEFLKKIAISNKIKDTNILKNIYNNIKISNVVSYDKFVIDDHIYIKLPLNNFE